MTLEGAAPSTRRQGGPGGARAWLLPLFPHRSHGSRVGVNWRSAHSVTLPLFACCPKEPAIASSSDPQTGPPAARAERARWVRSTKAAQWGRSCSVQPASERPHICASLAAQALARRPLGAPAWRPCTPVSLFSFSLLLTTHDTKLHTGLTGRIKQRPAPPPPALLTDPRAPPPPARPARPRAAARCHPQCLPAAR